MREAASPPTVVSACLVNIEWWEGRLCTGSAAASAPHAHVAVATAECPVSREHRPALNCALIPSPIIEGTVFAAYWNPYWIFFTLHA